LQVVGAHKEASLEEVYKYFELAKQAPHGCKTCFVASDDITSVLTVSQSSPSFGTQANRWFPELETLSHRAPPLTLGTPRMSCAFTGVQEFRQTIGAYFPDCEIKHLSDRQLTSHGYDWRTFRHRFE
jgi:hypothetical protein